MSDADDPGVSDVEIAVHLRAGAAVYGAGEHHAAHDAWEAVWLDLDPGPDRRLLQGLIQTTAAVHHAREGNAAGATGLAGSAREYFDGLGERYRGVALAPVRAYLRRLEADPGAWDPPVDLVIDGETVVVEELEIGALGVAAGAVAEAAGEEEESLVADAVRYAREDLDGGQTSRFVGLLVAYVRGGERPTVRARLRSHVERRRARERDVEGLFGDAGRTGDGSDGDDGTGG